MAMRVDAQSMSNLNARCKVATASARCNFNFEQVSMTLHIEVTCRQLAEPRTRRVRYPCRLCPALQWPLRHGRLVARRSPRRR